MELSPQLGALLLKGTVIPAHPLALDASRSLDEESQRRLTRYYLSAGVGGLAVGVHTTQFAIREPGIDLFERVLKMASEEVEYFGVGNSILRIAGVCGPTDQAVNEAHLAQSLGYDMVLISPGGLGDWTEEALLDRAQKVGEVMPLFGFYLQPAVGGRVLSESFWREFCEIPSVKAIKIAPFNRYQTLDVVRAVCQCSRPEQIALYTGNDDNIVLDLLTDFRFHTDRGLVKKSIVGGLLGHWAVWTSKAVTLLQEIHRMKKWRLPLSREMLELNTRVTDANAAFFDASNQFKGCIAGIHEVLRRQGLMKGTWCLDPNEQLSKGQAQEIDRVYASYPDLHDDEFVRQFMRGNSF